jgi:hypothetical protein
MVRVCNVMGVFAYPGRSFPIDSSGVRHALAVSGQNGTAVKTRNGKVYTDPKK